MIDFPRIKPALITLIAFFCVAVSGPVFAEEQLSFARIDRLTGAQNGEITTLPRLRQAVFELKKSGTHQTYWPDLRHLEQAQLDVVSRNVIPLALINARHEQKPVFAFSPLREKNYFPRDTDFLISSNAILQGPGSPEIIHLEMDAGDGLGWREIALDQAIKVSYAARGEITLKLQATLADGSQSFASSLIEIPEGPVPPPPTDTWMVTAAEPYMGAVGTGQAYLYLAPGNTQLTRPVVVIEGFDIDNSIDWPVLYELLNQEQLLEDLRSMGYDAVVLDFTEAVDPIQRNAFVFTRLLELIQAEIGPERSMAVVGASMGGLVGRYGLLWMEDQGLDHQVRNFISFDSPHAGANIPLGLQHWLAFFADQSEDAEFFLSRLNSPAARQMLLYHINGTSGMSAAADPLQASFNADLASLGNWPLDTRLASVINGSGSMNNQGFAASDQLLEWEHRSLTVDIDGNVWSVPDGGSQLIFEGLLDIILLPEVTETLTITGTLPWDNAPGGNRPTMAQIAEPEAPFGEIVALHDSHSFIPSISALALNSNNPFYDIAGDTNLLSNVPFDAVYFPVENQEHILITAENKNWFISEIGFGLPSDVIQEDGFESP